MDKHNHKDKGNDGPGIKWNPNSVGDYKRGLNTGGLGKAETEHRKGAGQK